MMKTPSFWYSPKKTFTSLLLSPLAQGYRLGDKLCRLIKRGKRFSSKATVICIGNIMVGGTGKTPVVSALVTLLEELGYGPSILTKGYGGSLIGPLMVDMTRHTPDEVGDEALLLSRQNHSVWVGKDRRFLAEMAEEMSDVLVLDDGFHDDSLRQDVRFIVFDGTIGMGNGCLFPAGPMRQSLKTGLSRANAVIIIGNDKTLLKNKIRVMKPECPIFNALSILDEGIVKRLGDKPLLAYAGIGRPEKFFDALDEAGLNVMRRYGFPDHHLYSNAEVRELEKLSEIYTLVTTEKDYMRIPTGLKAKTKMIPMRLEFQSPKTIADFLRQRMTDHVKAR